MPTPIAILAPVESDEPQFELQECEPVRELMSEMSPDTMKRRTQRTALEPMAHYIQQLLPQERIPCYVTSLRFARV